MPRSPKNFQEIGVDGGYDLRSGIRNDDFITELRGLRGIKKYREMRDNDPIIGAVVMSLEMLARSAQWSFVAADDSPAAAEGKAFARSVLFRGMEHTFDDFLSDAMTCLPFGFSMFEKVYYRRRDGKIGIRKLGPRAQWTVSEFDIDQNGRFLGVYQDTVTQWSRTYIPREKPLIFNASSSYGDPAGRSVLRNAYRSYLYVKHIQEYEAIAIERELNGLPVGRIPASYMSPDASDENRAFVEKMKQVLRDVKKNEQGYILLPSDLYEDDDGKMTTTYQVDFSLVASSGSRDIDTDTVIKRHQADMARTVLADFLTLGSSDRGSFAMSDSKTGIFTKAMKSFLESIAAPINRELLPEVWRLNSMPMSTLPRLSYQDIAPVNLDELGKFIRSMALAGAPLFPDEELENSARRAAGLSEKTQEERYKETDA